MNRRLTTIITNGSAGFFIKEDVNDEVKADVKAGEEAILMVRLTRLNMKKKL